MRDGTQGVLVLRLAGSYVEEGTVMFGSRNAKFLAVVWLLSCFGLGCASDASDGGNVDDDSLDEASQAVLGPTWTEAPLSWHGGTGGAFTGNVPGNAIIRGVKLRHYAEIDSISFNWYQPVNEDNAACNWKARECPVGWSARLGGTTGVESIFNCPAGKGIIGIQGRAGKRLDAIQFLCGDVNNPDPTSPLNSWSPLFGGSGGTWFGLDACPRGRLVSGFNIRSGSRVDRIQAICVDAH